MSKCLAIENHNILLWDYTQSFNQSQQYVLSTKLPTAFPCPYQCVSTVSNLPLMRYSRLLIPSNSFVALFFLSTFLLHRPCIYCSALLIILFISSCNWSDRCFVDFSQNWFESRTRSSPLPNPLPAAANWSDMGGKGYMDDGSFWKAAVNETASLLGTAAKEELKRRMPTKTEWTGLGMGWMRSWLGAREWRLPCLDIYVRL